MKRLCFILVFCFIATTSIIAQNVTIEEIWFELAKIANEEALYYEIDFSNAIINAQEVEIFIEHESRWEEGVKDINYRFMNAFNKQAFKGNTPHRISSLQKHQTTLNVKVLQVTTCLFSGNTTSIKAIVSVIDKEGTTLLTQYIEKKNGVIGTNLRLIGDALEAVGETVGRAFYRYAVPQK